MRRTLSVLTGLAFLVVGAFPLHAHSDGVFTIHEVSGKVAPKATLDLEKDPTGGFNVHVVTSNFIWRPEQASKEYVAGEGHAHVYLDGRKIMRIYSEWFHLNTYQFATRAGEQLLSIEFVGNDHAPYTMQGNPIGSEQIITVPRDEIQPVSTNRVRATTLGIVCVVILLTGAVFWRRFRAQKNRRVERLA